MGGPGGPPHGWEEPLGGIMAYETLGCIISAIFGGLFALLMLA